MGPVWRALQQSKTTVSKFGKLGSDPKPNFQTKGIFLTSNQNQNSNQDRSNQRYQKFPSSIPSQQRTQVYRCPIKCTQDSFHPWGCLSYCDVFKSKDLAIKKDIVKKGRICVGFFV